MKILVIGATGRTGKEIVGQALAKGYEVIAYVRRPEAVPKRKNLHVVGGQLNDPESLALALQGVDAVLMAIGNSITNLNDKLFEFAIPTVIQAMNDAGVKRLINLSALGVGETYKNTRYPYRLAVKAFLKGNFKDHLAGESQLKNSGLNWTTIHPGPLSNGAKTRNPLVMDAATGYKRSGFSFTSRADVAQVMLRIIDDETTFGKQLIM